ncbi:MAG: RimK family alpha-L-glutamate ligase [Clostridia bacterium]|nr:RimK family alpha-L-glutamate ligase [Clostridia bacterium]
MAGFVLYNGFWNKQSVPDPVRRLCDAGQALSFPLSPRPNTSFAAVIDGGAHTQGIQPGDVVLCWDKDVRLLRAMEADGAHVYNSADGVAVCDDKAATHLRLASANVPMPRTLIAPMTYVHFDEAGDTFLAAAEESLSFPMVLKECFGSLGEQVYLVRDAAELRALAASMNAKPFILQEFIRESAGSDKRLYVVGDCVVAAMRRRSDTDFRANIGSGGRGEGYTPTPQEAALALTCCRVLGLHFGGVDLLDSDRGPLVCEVNASAHMAALTACTGVDVAKEIVTYVKQKETEYVHSNS